MKRVWKKSNVRNLTREQELEVVRILASKGTTLHLSRDEFNEIDGWTEKGGRPRALVEIKSRSDRWTHYIQLGSLLVDASKIRFLQREAREKRLKAILLVYTADKVLAWTELRGEYETEARVCRKNHHSEEMVEKEVILIPIAEFHAIYPQGWHIDPLNHITPIDPDVFGERAAIREYDGGFDRSTAERLAKQDIVYNRVKRLMDATDELVDLLGKRM